MGKTTPDTGTLSYHVLPDDPLRAVNVLRKEAGLELWSGEADENQDDE